MKASARCRALGFFFFFFVVCAELQLELRLENRFRPFLILMTYLYVLSLFSSRKLMAGFVLVQLISVGVKKII